jgi:hypothetical protein
MARPSNYWPELRARAVRMVAELTPEYPSRHCCVGRFAGGRDWLDDCPPHDLRLRWLPVPPEVISLAVRWYLRYGLSYRDVEELLAERGITVGHDRSRARVSAGAR